MRTPRPAKRLRRVRTALILALSLVPLLAMKTGIAQEGGGGPLSVPDDWTSRHVIFSGARSEAAAEKLADEPRYLHQWLKHNRPLRRGDRARESNGRFAGPVAGDQLAAPTVAETYPVPGLTSLYLAAERAAARRPQPKPEPAVSGLKQDWASALPAGARVGAGMYPAKFTFDAAAAPDCTNDYVAYNTGLAPNPVAASRTGTFTATWFQTPSGTVTIGGTLVLTASSSNNTGTNFQVNWYADNTSSATNLAAAIVRNGAPVGVTATSSGATVTVTATAPGAAGNSITLAYTLTRFSWAGTTLTGGADSTIPSIVAYNNLYSTQSATLQGACGGSGPSVRWSYATGTGSVVASPVLSLDGTKIIYVETKASGAVLHILQWKSGGEGGGTTPATPTTVTSWGSCGVGASCVVNVAFNGGQQATKSAPFYDYANDVAYVGDNAGVLHKFSPVLSGTPAEVTTGGWPVTVDAGYVLNSPVLDPGTNRVFLTDSNGTNSKVCYVTTAPAVTCTANLAGIISDPVVVDSSAGRVFAFSTVSGATVHQYTTSLASAVTANVAPAGANANPVFAGAFDNTYLTSALGTGKMYVCGKSPSSADRAALYRISITSGTMSASYDTGQLVLVDGTGGCSPVTEFYNATTGMDWIFLSVGNNAGPGMGSTCDTPDIGCVASLNVTGTAWPPTSPATMTAGYVTPGNSTSPSASGIIIDNSAGTTTVPGTLVSEALDATETGIDVVSSAGFTAGDFIQVDAERMRITSIDVNTLNVARGQLSSTAATHLTGTAAVALRVTLMTVASGTDATIDVYSTTTFNVGDYIQIDNEAMLITGKAGMTLTVSRAQLGSSNVNHATLTSQVVNLSVYPQAASVYFSFAANSVTAAQCNGSTGVGCAVKLTQDGLR